MAEVSLHCPAGGDCSYKTEKLPVNDAMALLGMHERTVHRTGGRSEGGSERNIKPLVLMSRWRNGRTLNLRGNNIRMNILFLGSA